MGRKKTIFIKFFTKNEMKYKNIREEELKNKVGADWFAAFDTTEIVGNIDFTVFPKQDNLFGRVPLLWAEAKTGNFDIPTMFVQLILTIGKARTFDKTLPPAFLGAFDFKKIAFVDYISVQDIFYLNDFNWNVTPSNHETKEFQLIKTRIETILTQNTYVYDYEKDEKELQTFIKNNVAKATTTSKLKIDKNNFIPIYLRWLETVKPTIDVNWDELKKANIMDSDFYLADLFVDNKDTQNIDDDVTIRDNLFVVFNNQGYKIAKENVNQIMDYSINLKNKETYLHFWKRYKRPPLKEFQDYIIERRDLLVPQDIRERKGAFFTPRIWVELSQKYLTDYLGENWQEDYYIWDCAAGTGNLLAGLTNKYNIYASTLDQADVNVIHERIDHGANLLKNNVFQFDFLNDAFTKLPQSLQDIINNEEKRKKLVVYINPPYAEAATYGDGENKRQVAAEHKTSFKYKDLIGRAINELFANFFIRIQLELPNCKLASFSTLKYINSQNFDKFRLNFNANFLNGFITPADTFDNVKGKFPIGFIFWDLNFKKNIQKIECDVYNKNGVYLKTKTYYSVEKGKYIINWLRLFFDKTNERIGYLRFQGTDFQTNSHVFITLKPTQNDIRESKVTNITINNIISILICLSVRQVFEQTWQNDRDQFLYPNDNWQTDSEFQNNCLAYALFHGQNRISSSGSSPSGRSGGDLNHWIPFTEQEVNAQAKFASNFITDFMKSPPRTKEVAAEDLFLPLSGLPTLLWLLTLSGFKTLTGLEATKGLEPLVFSPEATAVFDAGRELWKYYHKTIPHNAPASGAGGINASLYDIREYFQGRNDKGRMNSKSDDATYMELINDLRSKLAILANAIKPKVYEYGFLKE
jgi:hypothetical protein